MKLETNEKISKTISTLWEDDGYRERQAEWRKNIPSMNDRKKQDAISGVLLKQLHREFSFSCPNCGEMLTNTEPTIFRAGKNSRLPYQRCSKCGFDRCSTPLEQLCAVGFFGRQLISIVGNDGEMSVEESTAAVQKLMTKKSFNWSSSDIKSHLMDRGLEMKTRTITKYVKTKLPPIVKTQVDGVNKFSLFDYQTETLVKRTQCPICGFNIWDEQDGDKKCAYCNTPYDPNYQPEPIITLDDVLIEFCNTHSTFTVNDLEKWMEQQSFNTILTNLKERYTGRYNHRVRLSQRLKSLSNKGKITQKIMRFNKGIAVWA